MQATLTDNPATVGERNQRILIIDDNTSIHEDVRKILGVASSEDTAHDEEAAELFGVEIGQHNDIPFEVDSAYQGEEGLAMVRCAAEEGRPYAMAFVDVRMPPGWDGIETISKIWRKYPDLQVVICTAYSDYSWEDMIRQVGKTDSLVILKKPFDNVEVLQLAHTLTQKWTLSNQLRCHLKGLDEIVATRTQELQSANTRLRQEMDERAVAELELRHSEERFEKAFKASPIPMAIQELATERFIDVNDAFLAITGIRRTEVTNRMPAELQIFPNAEAHRELWLRLQREGSVRSIESQLRTTTGESRDCVVSAEVFDLGGKAVALVATLDVSEQRNLERQLRHSQKLEAVGQFASGVAHDFNNMLTVIQGYTSLSLAASGLDADVTNSLQQVALAADRATALTRQLLTFSRKQMVQLRVLDLNDTLRNLHAMLRRVIGEEIELSCEFDERRPAIFADESNIEQVVMNLVVNARDAMPQGGRLAIRTEAVTIDPAYIRRHAEARLGDFACLTISDSGCGMSPETLSHIFEPFFTTKEVGKGTGIGLATVYGIVSQLGGWLEVKSQIGEGTVLRILLPATAEEAEPVAISDIDDVYGGGEKILLVEDEHTVREIITAILRDHGYEVWDAADGPGAIQLWQERGARFDMLITDIIMPNGVKGNELAARLQGEKPGLKVIFSSGYSSNFGTQAEPLPDGCSFLAKPYKPEVLVRAVRDCLGN
jgi:two-component system cell cycle sensor histidine kinase/response regulator CckA